MNLKKYYRIIKLKRFSGIIISLTAVISIIIILFTLYGNQIGNFVVTIEDRNRFNLSLSETPDFSKQFSRLTAAGVKDMREATYDDIPDDIGAKDGSSNDKQNDRYLAYTFYLKNMDDNRAIGYNAKMVINQATKKVDSAIRIMVIINDNTRNIYAKPKEAPEPEELWGTPENHEGEFDWFGKPIIKPYSTISFLSPVTVYEALDLEIAAGGIDKYTVVIWIEGMDAQCTNDKFLDIMGGTLKLSMEFSVI